MATSDADASTDPTPHLDTSVLPDLLSRVGMAVAATDRAGRLSMLSPALQDLLHNPWRSVPTHNLPEAYHLYGQYGAVPLKPEDLPLHQTHMDGAMHHAIITVRAPGWSVRHLLSQATSLTNESGERCGALAVVTDITDQLLGRDFVESVNHHLRTPLAIVLGHAELLARQDLELPEEAQHSLESLQRAARRLNRAVEWVSEVVDGASNRGGDDPDPPAPRRS